MKSAFICIICGLLLLTGCFGGTGKADWTLHAASKTVARPLAMEAASLIETESFKVDVLKTPPAQDFIIHTPYEGFVNRQICWTAIVNYVVTAGTWGVEWNYRPMSATVVSNGWEGMNWLIISPYIGGPASGQMTLPVPASPTGFFRMRKL